MQPTLVVTSVTALLQRTFAPGEMKAGTRVLNRGDRIEPLDLVEWLEDQGYEPEAQVTQRGELALRGGILDVYPLTSPWPVRLEFFGDELESLRYFDPITQVSREETAMVTLPPGGELGMLKKAHGIEPAPVNKGSPPLATLADYLPSNSIFLLCEPEKLEEQAEQYAQQVPENDAFYISWADFEEQLQAKGITRLSVREDASVPSDETDDAEPTATPAVAANEPINLNLPSLDAFRPLGALAPEPQIAEAQRREFFAQLHRWLRQGHEVHVFCNNDGERQRFERNLE